MTVTREQFVAEVLTWLGTPFRHRARVKGVGCDCVGLPIGACKNLGIAIQDTTNYPRVPIHGIFGRLVDEQTVPVEFKDILPGDVLKFQWTTEPQHIAVVVSINPIRIVHAYNSVKSCVISDFDKVWQSRFTDARRLKVFA
jgi:cell wall-associated NlpC family hydrolase